MSDLLLRINEETYRLQRSMEYEEVKCHVQTDMLLTHCDYKTKEHGI
jgi:hypothetical protein